MVGVAQDNLRAELLQHLLRNGFDGCLRAHRHKDRRLDRCVRQMELRAAGRPRGCLYLEVQDGQILVYSAIRAAVVGEA